jgi:hypothetical protein
VVLNVVSFPAINSPLSLVCVRSHTNHTLITHHVSICTHNEFTFCRGGLTLERTHSLTHTFSLIFHPTLTHSLTLLVKWTLNSK